MAELQLYLTIVEDNCAPSEPIPVGKVEFVPDQCMVIDVVGQFVGHPVALAGVGLTMDRTKPAMVDPSHPELVYTAPVPDIKRVNAMTYLKARDRALYLEAPSGHPIIHWIMEVMRAHTNALRPKVLKFDTTERTR